MIARATEFAGLYDRRIVDLFAGAGGASTGIEEAFMRAGIQRHVDIAVDHDRDAIACHARNHPLTEHLHQDVWEVDPEAVCAGRRVGLLWASPDCTDFSKAKGGRPIRNVKRRSLAHVVIRWAFAVRPDVVLLENVEEFRQWGLIDGYGMPIRDGRCFTAWKSSLQHLGYQVEAKELRACDYGTPTTRNRLYVIARCDGLPIRWPEKTHGPVSNKEGNRRAGVSRVQVQGMQCGLHRPDGDLPRAVAVSAVPGRGAAEGEGSRSPGKAAKGILKPFRTAAECIDWGIPMLSIFATQEEATAWGRRHGMPRPRRPLAGATMRRIARGTVRYVLQAARPFIVRVGQGDGRDESIDRPMSTITAGHHNKALVNAVIAPFSIGVGGPAYSGKPRSLHQPLGTVMVEDRRAIVSAFLAGCGGRAGQSRPRAVDEPVATVTGKADAIVAAAHLLHLRGTNVSGEPIDHPAPTITGGGTHTGLVAAFLQTYYGSADVGQGPDTPLRTIPCHDRFGLVIVNIDGQTYAITDIAMRMLTPRELARAQGFRDDYVIDQAADGRRLSKRVQVRLIGNSVCRHVSRALVASNVIGVCDWAMPPRKVRSRRRTQEVAA